MAERRKISIRFYNDREVTTQTAAGPKKDVYSRKNHSFGIGFNLDL